MTATLLGATVIYGPDGTTVSALPGYIVLSQTSGGNEVSNEDVEDAYGKRQSRIVMGVYPKEQLTLVATTGTFTEFVEGALVAGVTIYASYYVSSLSVVKVKGARQGTVTLDKIFG